MVKGKIKTELTKETILDRITEYDVYRYYFGNFELNEVTTNHLRGEHAPSIIIGDKFGKLIHKDLGDFYWRGDCFNLVQQIHRCDYPTALRIVDKDFNLGINEGKDVQKSDVIRWMQPKETIIKPAPFFQVVERRPNNDELRYWNEYFLDIEDVKKAEIYFPKSIYRNRQKLYLGNLLTFCYWYEELRVWKLYRPHAPKRMKDTPVNQWKWDTGKIPFDYCDNLKNIKSCHYAFLTKSRKDRAFLIKTLGIDCVADVQAEDPSCINDVTIETFKKNSQVQVTVFDGDKNGKESSWWLTNNHGFKHCNVPDHLLSEGITDFADMGKKYGMESVISHFQNKGYI